jgi:hypothetical protein
MSKYSELRIFDSFAAALAYYYIIQPVAVDKKMRKKFQIADIVCTPESI